MGYSGLASRDAVTLGRDELKRDSGKGLYKVATSRQKTGTHVSVAIPDDVAAEVKAAMELNELPQYAFWNTGTGKPQTARHQLAARSTASLPASSDARGPSSPTAGYLRRGAARERRTAGGWEWGVRARPDQDD